MNAGFDSHIPEDWLENYAFGKLSAQPSAIVEEHLLICASCLIHLDEVEEYIALVRAAVLSMNAAVSQLRPVKKGSPSRAGLRVLDSVLSLSSKYSTT